MSVSGTQATINPPSDLAYETDQYIVVDENSFFNSDGDADSGNAEINTYNFTTEAELSPGDAFEGGYLICAASNNYWIVAPSGAEVSRRYNDRNESNTRAQQVSSCTGWFVPSSGQLAGLSGSTYITYWDSYCSEYYWSNTTYGSNCAYAVYVPTAGSYPFFPRSEIKCIRSFRCVTY